jgi:hypothetical protein
MPAKGVTLIEMVMTLVIFMLVSGLAVQWLNAPLRHAFYLKNANHYFSDLTHALDFISQQLPPYPVARVNIEHNLHSKTLRLISTEPWVQPLQLHCDFSQQQLWYQAPAKTIDDVVPASLLAESVLGCDFATQFLTEPSSSILYFQLTLGATNHHALSLTKFWQVAHDVPS